jgi:hypothetical protein
MDSWLAIDYGAAYTRAVLVRPDGTWTVLPLDGGVDMPSAVHVSEAGMTVGAAAWQHAAGAPDGFVASPLRAGAEQVTVNGGQVEVAELVAATLRQVAEEAALAAGEPPGDVRIVVPAAWGPRRRTWLRTAARRAGLPQPRLVEAPTAAAAYLGPAGGGSAGTVLVVDVGAGCEVSVLQYTSGGVEVLSTLADPAAGGDRIDASLTVVCTGTDLDDLPAEQRWTTLAAVRAAKHALSEQTALVLPLPGGALPIVVTAAQVAQVAEPVFQRVGELAAEAVGLADLSPGQVGAVHLVGAAASTPGARPTITAALGVDARPAPQPGLAAVLGAGGVNVRHGPPAGIRTDVAMRLPPLRRLLTLLIPGLASLGLFAHFVFSAYVSIDGPRASQLPHYVLAVWGELVVAGVLAMITSVQGASLLAVLMSQDPDTGQARPDSPTRIVRGLIRAVGCGVAVAGLYAVTAAVHFAYPVTDLLRWALLPVLPIAAGVLALAVLAWRRPITPPAGWDAVLAFPASSVITVTAGTVAVAVWWHTGMPWWLGGWKDLVGYLGGLLIGVAIACTLVRHPAVRVALIVLLGFLALIISKSGPDILAVIYAISVAAWLARRVAALSRTRPAVPGRTDTLITAPGPR